MSDIKTVLLVDGDFAAISANSDYLQREGFQVETAEDGSEALFQMATLPIDIVVLDLILPTFSGAEVFKRMRADDRLKEVPVVILSNAPKHKRPQDLRGGPTRLLVKNDTDFPTLLKCIKEVLAASTVDWTKNSAADSSFCSRSNPSSTRVAAIPKTPAGSSETPSLNGSSSFLTKVAKALPKIREDCFGYVKSPATSEGQQRLAALRENVNSLDTSSKKAGCARINLLTKPFEALLSSIAAKPATATPSILQTVAQAVDCLVLIVNHGSEAAFGSMLTPHALVVDDDPVSNEVNVTALQQAGFDTTCIEDPLTALELLSGTAFDLVVLDVNMPTLTGFEVCEKLRALPQGKTMPVIFLTAFNNFENRKKSVLSGGGDFITKPVSTRELALKATIHLLKSQLRSSAANTASDKVAAPVPILNESSNGVADRSEAATALQPERNTANEASGSNSRISFPTDNAVASEKNQAGLDARSGLVPKARNGKTHNSRTPQAQVSNESGNLQPKSTSQTQSPDQPTSIQAEGKPHDVSSTAPAQVKKGSDMFANHENKTATLSHPTSGTAGVRMEAIQASDDQSELVHGELFTRCRQLEQELAEIRQSRDELQDKLKTGGKTSPNSEKIIQDLQEQLRKKTAELERVDADATNRSTGSDQSGSGFREKLNATELTIGRMETALKEKEDSYRLLEEELVPLRKIRDQLQQKQQQGAADLERLKANLAQENADRARSETELHAQLNAAKLALDSTETALREKEDSYRLLEEELTPLRNAREQFQQKQRLNAAELERIKSDLTKQAAAHAESESNLREQLDAAKKTAAQTEVTLKEKEVRCQELEQALPPLQQKCHQLEKSQKEAEAELERAKADLTQQSAAYAKSESDLRDQLTEAKQSLAQTQTTLSETQTRCRALEGELSEAHKERDQLQDQQQKTAVELTNTKAALERESSDRVRLESEGLALAKAKKELQSDLVQLQESLAASNAKTLDVELQLQESKASVASLTVELEKEREERQRVEQRATTLGTRLRGLHEELGKHLAG